MCGIAGFTHNQPIEDRTLIQRMTQAIKHRGPDDDGVYVSGAICLGAVRLKIIDLASGHQPLRDEATGTILVYNGEIYNYRELRTQLMDLGHRFESASDTEVVLRAFLQWDTGCFSRFKGMFALALWEERSKRLVLARDRMGIKPLYFCAVRNQLCFGSEMKVLFEHPEVARSLDLLALDQYLSLNYVPCPRTLVNDIEKLHPGHFLEWHAGQIRISAYWKLQLKPDKHISESAALEQLDHLLRQSVKEHLVSDVPLGVLLSGGVDSSTMVHYAANSSPERLKTFSISFAGRSFDERPYFHKVAERYGTDHHEFDLARDLDLPATIQQFAQYADEPCGDSSSLPVWYLSKMCRRHVTVALSGEGADELFGGYLTYRANQVARWIRHIPASLRRGALAAAERCWPVSDDKLSLEYMAKRFLQGSLLHPLVAHCFWNGAFSAAQKTSLLTFPAAGSWEKGLSASGDDLDFTLNRFLEFDQKYYLVDDILAKVDRMSMAHSLEVRPPFLDHELIEFVARLPDHFKIRGSQQKYILKKLMRGKLPDAILDRKKTGFDIPAHDWMRRELRPLLMEAIDPAVLSRTGLMRPDVLHSWVQAHMERRVNIGFHLWGLLILLLWMEKWKIQSPEEPTTERQQWRPLAAGWATS